MITTVRKLSYISDIAIDDVRLYNCSGNIHHYITALQQKKIASFSTDFAKNKKKNPLVGIPTALASTFPGFNFIPTRTSFFSTSNGEIGQCQIDQ